MRNIVGLCWWRSRLERWLGYVEFVLHNVHEFYGINAGRVPPQDMTASFQILDKF
jgi:hypothetical protein